MKGITVRLAITGGLSLTDAILPLARRSGRGVRGEGTSA
jgi:hypothetical protein